LALLLVHCDIVCHIALRCLIADVQTGAFPGMRLPIFSVQMVRFRSAAASSHPFVVYDMKYEIATEE
jgi:hypothetical protein